MLRSISLRVVLASLLGACTNCGLLSGHVHAQESNAASGNASSATTIPFELTDANNILIAAKFNGTDTAKLMLHTAVNSVSVTSGGAEKLKSLNFDQTVDVKSWGGEQKARLSTGNALQIGEFTWDDLQITEGALSAPGSDGKFGLNLFAGKVVEIDFDARELNLYKSLPPHLSEFDRLKLSRNAGGLFIRGELQVGESLIEQEFLIHSGYSGTLLLDDAFVAEHKALGDLPLISENELKDSYGNIIKTRKVQLPRLCLGEIEFSDLPAGYFAGTVGRQTMSVFGGGLLRRFTVAFDADREHIYLRPAKSFNQDW